MVFGTKIWDIQMDPTSIVLLMQNAIGNILTSWHNNLLCPVTPYGETKLLNICLVYGLVPGVRKQAITWTIVDLSSVRSGDTHLKASSEELLQPSQY